MPSVIVMIVSMPASAASSTESAANRGGTKIIAVFAPVWTVLYGLMAVAGWLVWKAGATARTRAALTLFAVQLVLNTAWSWLFFGLERADLALLCIVLLWGAILATTLAFRRVRPLAAALLLPYLVWVSFAAALNFEIWRLN